MSEKVIIELKNCPFCGGKVKATTFMGMSDSWTVLCLSKGCEILGPIKVTEQEAITVWNKRAKEPMPCSGDNCMGFTIPETQEVIDEDENA